MNNLGHELRMVQNPALGAAILWRFSKKYAEAQSIGKSPPFCLLPLILPMIWHADTEEIISSTRESSGLRAFSNKFSDAQHSQLDVLLGLQKRATDWKSKTMESFRLGLASGLLCLDSNGEVQASDEVWKPAKFPLPVRGLLKSSEKLGVWFSTVSPLEVANTLIIKF